MPTTSDCKVIKTCLCCHCNKVSIATSDTTDCYLSHGICVLNMNFLQLHALKLSMTTIHTRDMYSKEVYVYQVSRIELICHQI